MESQQAESVPKTTEELVAFLLEKYKDYIPTVAFLNENKIEDDLGDTINSYIAQINREVTPEEIQKRRDMYKKYGVNKSDKDLEEDIRSNREHKRSSKIYDLVLRPGVSNYLTSDTKPTTEDEFEEKEMEILDYLWEFKDAVKGATN